MKIAVANAAVGNGNLNFLWAQLAGIVVIGQKLCTSRVNCKSLYLSHGFRVFLFGI
jgi:hypothetical protein